VRLVVVDSAAEPALEALVEAEPALVHTVAADQDMPGLLNELARMGGTTAPDGQFRVHFTAMASALGGGKIPEAQRAADSALAVASREGWLHLVGAVHFAMAAGFLNAGRTGEAVTAYRQADAAGKELAQTDEALGSRLRLSSAFGLGSALVGSKDFASAAVVYEASTPMAQTVGDPYLLVECSRMAAYCHEQTGDRTKAWERGFMALDAAEAIPPQERAHSMIPFVREGLLRLAGDSQPHVEAIERRVAELMGSGEGAASAAGSGTAP
jgi:hypothetical protein